MRYAIALILLLLAPLAQAADLVLQTEGLTIRLRSAPCTAPEVLQHINPQYREAFLAADIDLNRKPVAGCWIDEGETLYLMLDDGSGGRMSKDTFKPGA